MERAGFQTYTAASHEGGRLKRFGSLFRTRAAHLIEPGKITKELL